MPTARKPEPQGDPVLYSVRAAAAALCIGEAKLRQLVRDGRLQSVALDSELRISRAALQAFADGLERPGRRLRAVRR